MGEEGNAPAALILRSEPARVSKDEGGVMSKLSDAAAGSIHNRLKGKTT